MLADIQIMETSKTKSEMDLDFELNSINKRDYFNLSSHGWKVVIYLPFQKLWIKSNFTNMLLYLLLRLNVQVLCPPSPTCCELSQEEVWP